MKTKTSCQPLIPSQPFSLMCSLNENQRVGAKQVFYWPTRGALRDSSHELRHCFSSEGLPLNGLSGALIGLCQAWSLSHIRHTSDRQPGAYHTPNKGATFLVYSQTRTHPATEEQWDTGSPQGIGPEQHFLCRRLISSVLCVFIKPLSSTIFILQSVCASPFFCFPFSSLPVGLK